MLQWKNHVHNRNLSNNLIYINGGGCVWCTLNYRVNEQFCFQIRVIALLKSQKSGQHLPLFQRLDFELSSRKVISRTHICLFVCDSVGFLMFGER